jgi:SRSO17 transposase
MKAANHHRDLFLSKSQCDIRCSAKLVGLHSHQADQYPLTGSAVEAEDPVQRHLVYGLIHHMNSQVYCA